MSKGKCPTGTVVVRYPLLYGVRSTQYYLGRKPTWNGERKEKTSTVVQVPGGDGSGSRKLIGSNRLVGWIDRVGIRRVHNSVPSPRRI